VALIAGDSINFIERSTMWNSVQDNVDVCYASGSFGTGSTHGDRKRRPTETGGS
jgi:hypothetical protein